MAQPSLFVPCLVDVFFPQVAEACLALLSRVGVRAVYRAEQTCCGQPAVNAGYWSAAAEAAKHFVRVFEGDEAVVCPSGSCVHTVKHRYREVLRNEPSWGRRAEALGSRVYELSQYLVDVLQVEDLGAAFRGKVAYHKSCQLARGLGVVEQPLSLLKAVRGLELVALDKSEMCCGFGGQFANSYPELSEAMVSEKAASYVASGAELLVASDPGCILNIGGYLSRKHPERRVVHIAEFLFEATETKGASTQASGNQATGRQASDNQAAGAGRGAREGPQA